ncbi:hypothetical protein CKO42_20115 [Lamprobacter modestohalophilus]|uniref:VWFA domain-containing protein n=2 Tax=Lamprobacter modestohalophilus TaxID=1064514 RepID=A0A9X0WBV5_9GAMM|nr:hypothetical protein [Lamprobacter modestohalophilus]
MSTRSLKQAMPIVAAALGRKFGVEVRVGGQEAFTDGRTIQVPALPDNRALLPVAWGYLAHEAGHLRYTDFEVYQQAAAESDALQANLQNILEDVRIEQALAIPYPGTRDTLQAVCAQLLADGGLGAAAANEHPGRILSRYLLLALRHQVLGYEGLAAAAKQAERVLRAVFPARTVHRLQGLLVEARHLASTAEAVELARRIRCLLEAERQADPAETAITPDSRAETPTPPETGAEADGQPSKAPASEQTQATDGHAANTDGHPSGPSGGKGTQTDSDSDFDKSAPSNAASPSALADQPDAVVSADSGHGDSGSAPTGAATPDNGDPAKHAAITQALSASAGDLPGDLFAQVKTLLEGASADSQRCILPRPEPYQGSASAGLRLLARVQPESRRLMARLQGLVQASRFDRPLPQRSGTRLMSKRLYRAALGDPRLFARKRERIAVNTALHLLIDLSSSMRAPVPLGHGLERLRSDIALESALALALALDAIPGVSLAVSAFPSRLGRESGISTLMRHGDRARAKAGAFVQEARGGTPMHGALWFAAADLLARPEPRRVILVLTDGKPADREATRALLAQCTDAGLETLGIGIGIDVSGLFASAIQVQDIAELKTQLFGAAERLLLAA